MLDWLYTAISWIMLRWHDLFSTFMDPASGLTWALSIAFLVITVRILLFRFFVKQVRTQRRMQELQPQIQKVREKYKNDRQAMSREVMKVQQEAGVNPLAGCLPILLQAPVFLALFHVLRRLKPGRDALYSWTDEQMESASSAKLFGAPLSAAFRTGSDTLNDLGADTTTVRIVTAIMVILMVAATYITQRQIMARNSGQLEGQAAMIQKVMLYGIPASLLVSGFIFPVGVLCYWLVNNFWTMGQQFYILKRMPPKGADEGKDDQPKIDPRVLAPKPGAKPVRPQGGKAPAGRAANQTEVAEPAEAETEDASADDGDDRGEDRPGSAKAGKPTGGDGASRPAKAGGTRQGTGSRGGGNRPPPGKRPANRSKKKRR